jgi:hypothetical protein
MCEFLDNLFRIPKETTADNSFGGIYGFALLQEYCGLGYNST